MIRKIIFILILCCVIVSCGKKGDPIYADLKKKIIIKKVDLNKV